MHFRVLPNYSECTVSVNMTMWQFCTEFEKHCLRLSHCTEFSSHRDCEINHRNLESYDCVGRTCLLIPPIHQMKPALVLLGLGGRRGGEGAGTVAGNKEIILESFLHRNLLIYK